MCVMTVLNIQFLSLFVDSVIIIWQVFIQILRYYGAKALRLCKNISPAPWGEGVRRTGEGFVGRQEDRKFRRQANISNEDLNTPTITNLSVVSQPFCPQNFCSSDFYPAALIRDAVTNRNCEPSGKRMLPVQNNRNGGNAILILPYVLDCYGSNEPCNDIMMLIPSFEGRANEQDRGSKGVVENQPSPHPSPIGEGVSNRHPELISGSHLMKQQVKHNANSPKRTYSPIHLFSYSLHKRAAFTLAEVLITLGIIGVVAAMTMPALIGSYRRSVTETKLQKFYSVMNQAIKLAEVDNGELSMWVPQRGDDSGDFGEWYNTYLDKNIKFLSKNYYSHYYHVAFADGSGFAAYIPSTSLPNADSVSAYIFYCTDYKYCFMPGSNGNFSEEDSYDGVHTFLFGICKNGKFTASAICSGNIYSREELLSGCSNTDPHSRHMCAALIQHDGWKISKDYPWIK